MSLGVQAWFGNEVIAVFSPGDIPRQTPLYLRAARWPRPRTQMLEPCPEKQQVLTSRGPFDRATPKYKGGEKKHSSARGRLHATMVEVGDCAINCTDHKAENTYYVTL